MSIEAMKQALEALEGCTTWHLTREQYDRNVTAIVALRAAIAEASMQRLTDTQQAIETAVADQAIYGMGITLGGKRIDPASIYKGSEPVAWADIEQGAISWMKGEYGPTWKPLYTHPPRREWVGLNMDELATLVVKTVGYPIKLAESIEAKLKEKNT